MLTCSVVIPTYNRAHLIARAIDSVLANLQPGDEIIVVDDGSTDATEAALAPYRDRIQLLHGKHAGVGPARNIGIRAAKCDLVAFIDSDDEWMPNKLTLQRALFEARPDVLFICSDFASRYADGQEFHKHLVTWHNDPRGWDQIVGPAVPFSALAPLPAGCSDFPVHIGSMYLSLMLGDYVATISLVARRVESGPALLFAEDLAFYEDCDCFAHLAKAGACAYFDAETVWQHGHAGPRMTDLDNFSKLSCRIRFLERNYGNDKDFLAKHGEAYAKRLAEQYHERARWLLVRGRMSEARADLARAGNVSLSERMLSRLPGFMARALLGLRRGMRGS